jgi:hypothetical protein
MRFSEFVLVMPAVFVVLALRSALPLVLPPATVFVLCPGSLRSSAGRGSRARSAA